MKLLADLLPVILFFLAYQWYDLYVATAVAVVTAALQIAAQHLRGKRVEQMQLLTLGLLVVFGGLTLMLRDPAFIKWKPTVVNWLFAALFIGSGWLTDRSILQRIMDHAIELPNAVWHRLNIAWSTFFVATGALNLYVAYGFAENVWVNFKLFGLLGLTLLFSLLQGIYIARYTPANIPNEGD